MKFLSTLKWMLRTAFVLVVGLLLVRTLVEYIPALQSAPLFRAVVRSWDPVLSDIVEGVGLSWSREVRALLLPGVAVALILLRTLVEDAVAGLFTKKARPRPVPEAPLDPAATVIKSVAGSASGTAFKPQGTSPPPQETGSTAIHIGRYEILGELGHGAMGVVYKAQDPKIGRTVAIKTLSATGLGSTEMEQYRARFLVEAKSAGRLNHPNVVAVHDVTDDEHGRPCLVLEFVEGTTLDRLVIEQHIPLVRLLELITQTARALAYAHAHGIIHRDVKPANIMVTRAGQAKLSDFGIAKLEGTSMTIAGQVMGTPAFMSPEQCTGSIIDHRSDIFSLGAVLYTLSAGEKPFPGDTFTSVAYKVVHAAPLPVRELNPALPDQLDGILAKCLAKNPDERYPSADVLAGDLEILRSTLPDTADAEAAPAA